MLDFNPADPYPLVEMNDFGGEIGKIALAAHAQQVDAWLDLQAERIERDLFQNEVLAHPPELAQAPTQELWLGLSVQSLLTPYAEIREILHRLAPQSGERIVDLGAGYARMAFVVARHYPQLEFTGYEFVPERVFEGRRCLVRAGLSAEVLIEADLSDRAFAPLPAAYYFIYDFGSRAAISKTLTDLERISEAGAISVVGRGRAAQETIERHHPWLVQSPPRYYANYSIYRSSAL